MTSAARLKIEVKKKPKVKNELRLQINLFKNRIFLDDLCEEVIEIAKKSAESYFFGTPPLTVDIRNDQFSMSNVTRRKGITLTGQISTGGKLT
jgi:hypothetical protein